MRVCQALHQPELRYMGVCVCVCAVHICVYELRYAAAVMCGQCHSPASLLVCVCVRVFVCGLSCVCVCVCVCVCEPQVTHLCLVICACMSVCLYECVSSCV